MDKYVKAIFREEARRIVSRDRSASKGGHSNNLPGDITTALVTAYKLGHEHAKNPPETPKPLIYDNALIWETVPPTSRNILSDLTFGFSQKSLTPTFKAYDLEQYQDENTGRTRWLVVESDGTPNPSNLSFAKKGVGPLLRLGLVEKHPEIYGRLRLTVAGDATCREYWIRSDRRDPTLPIQGMRG